MDMKRQIKYSMIAISAMMGYLVVHLFLLVSACSADICFTEQDAARLVVEVEQGRVCSQEVELYQKSLSNAEERLKLSDTAIKEYKAQIQRDEQTIERLKKLLVQPNFKLMLETSLYAEMKVWGTTSSDLMRVGLRFDILRLKNIIFYGKAEGSFRDDLIDNKKVNGTVYGGIEWRILR